MCGSSELPDFVENMRFTAEDVAYLASLEAPAGGRLFKPGFLGFLRRLPQHVDIDAVPEGELVFPREPMVRVTGPVLECQLLETALLNTIGFQTLVATKASRVVRPPRAAPWPSSGFVAPRARTAASPSPARAMSRAARRPPTSWRGAATGSPSSGTHAHSWVMSFPVELVGVPGVRGDEPQELHAADRYLRRARGRRARDRGRQARWRPAASALGHPHRLGRPRAPLHVCALSLRRGGPGLRQGLVSNDLDEYTITRCSTKALRSTPSAWAPSSPPATTSLPWAASTSSRPAAGASGEPVDPGGQALRAALQAHDPRHPAGSAATWMPAARRCAT